MVNQHDLVATGGPFTRGGSATGERRVVKDRYDSRVLDLDVGDLNGDGITDVVAAENGTDTFDSRRIAYWWGTKDGLTPYTLVYDIDGAGLQGGENLAVGDVNRDGYADIVVGRTVEGYESDGDTYRAKGGRVTWIPGTSGAPDGVSAQFVNQDNPGVPGTAEKGDGFGTDVQLADVDGDGYLDVVTGVPGEDLGTPTDPDAWPDAGSVVVLSGRADGLTGAISTRWSRRTAQACRVPPRRATPSAGPSMWVTRTATDWPTSRSALPARTRARGPCGPSAPGGVRRVAWRCAASGHHPGAERNVHLRPHPARYDRREGPSGLGLRQLNPKDRQSAVS